MNLLNKLVQVVFPDVCIGCNCRLLKNENSICIKCHLHLLDYSYDYKSNYLRELFEPHFVVASVFSLFFFDKHSPLQLIIHDLKYKSLLKNGDFLGDLFLENDRFNDILNHVDFIIPIPIHSKRYNERGYNQSEIIANYINSKKTIKYKEDFIRTRFKNSQTSKSRTQRWENLNNSFKFTGSNKKYEGKHVLIIDDVITTGSTIISFVELLNNTFSDIKISVASVAITLP